MSTTCWAAKVSHTIGTPGRGRVLVDAVLLPSPYASSFGGFVELPFILWWTAGGLASWLFHAFDRKPATGEKITEGELPSDMSTTSLVGGGLIAGDSLAALTVGITKLIQTMLHY